MMTRSLSWMLVPMFLGTPAATLRPAPEAQVTAMSLTSSGGTARLAIAVTGKVTVKDVVYHDPDRLVLDLEGATLADLTGYDGRQRGIVTSVRQRQHLPNVVRVVLEFDRLPEFQIDRSTPGIVTVAFADSPFDTWSASNGGAKAIASDVRAPEPRAQEARAEASTAPSRNGLRVGPMAPRADDPRISVTYDKTPIEDVIYSFAKAGKRSIVTGKGISGTVSMTLEDQTWSDAFEAFLATQGLSAVVMKGGIIRVDAPGELSRLDSIEVLETRQVRLNYAKAGEMAKSVEGMITKNRGKIIPDTSSNSLIITDSRTRIENIVDFVHSLDIRTPTVSIQAKLIFVDRTDLQQLGLKYDIGTGQQFNNKLIQRTDPSTGQPYNPNTNIVNLGGNAVSGISNADALISGSALDLVFSTAIGGFSVTSFLSALERVELTDVQAVPIINTLDNRKANILSGEETPVRVIDASSFGQVNQAPRANVTFKETGIKLVATPHVTNNRQILLDLEVERSSIQALAAVDLGFTIPKQRAENHLLVNDGETAVIGGLTVTTVTRNRSGIPLLSSLPFVGNLFSFTENRENRKDLIILVMPRILDDPTPP
ncbi:MAG: secretin N-terminal domain-containing protein [Gemmatimonadota bacterium]